MFIPVSKLKLMPEVRLLCAFTSDGSFETPCYFEASPFLSVAQVAEPQFAVERHSLSHPLTVKYLVHQVFL